MIQLEAVKIIEFRGIRELNLTLGRKNFVISGPNGAGKSGVVDAIQFGLTGAISRLSGKGRGDLGVRKYAPHVDRRGDPAAAEVALKLYFPNLDKTAVLTRNVKTPRAFALVPEDAAVRAEIEEAARHPELTLSRREIIKYILVEASERSKEIQALLQLEEIGINRGVLKTAWNRVTSTHKLARQDTADAADALRTHLDVETVTPGVILTVVNEHRHVLGLPPITILSAESVLDAGDTADAPRAKFNKSTAIRDLNTLKEAQESFASLGAAEVEAILGDIATLEGDSELLAALRQRSFVERGLDLVDASHCPLCDMEWDDAEALRAHLRAKLARSQQAEIVHDRLLNNAATIANHARHLAALLTPVRTLAASEGQTAFAADLEAWAESLVTFTDSAETVEDLLCQKTKFQRGWLGTPPSLAAGVDSLIAEVNTIPDQSGLVTAHSFLTLARDRLKSFEQAQQAERRAKNAAELGNLAYTTYCDVAAQHLSGLYTSVEGEFSRYYRAINVDDESGFRAKFESAESKLNLSVDFYNRGMFPPGAYHSEGHQDGMGVCLYLALMKHLLGNRFRLAVLDDVVMSVDRDHRKQFCHLLSTEFSDTQFVITTHDRVWAKQMQTAGLVESRSGVEFRRWNVETGPVFEEITEAWDQIEADIARNDIEAAASKLRRHLEYVCGELAHDLGAKLRYRGDMSYDFGDLWTAVIGRQGELLRLAAKSANRWNDSDAKTRVAEMQEERSNALAACGGEQWMINRAIHYNEWATFPEGEFRTVVRAFRRLLLQLRCPKGGCGSWLYLVPSRGDADVMRCRCNQISLNLRMK